MDRKTWIETFPVRRTKQGSKPGKGAYFQLDVRVYPGGNSFLTELTHQNDPQPATTEDQAVELFRALWHRAHGLSLSDAAEDDAAAVGSEAAGVQGA